MVELVIGVIPVNSRGQELAEFQDPFIAWNDDARTNHTKMMTMVVRGDELIKFFAFATDDEAALFKLTHL